MKGISYPKCYALVSGGKDSLTTAKVLQKAGLLEAAVAIKTRLSTPDWEEFVRRVCDEHNMPLEIYETDESYEKLVLQYGFPGPTKHKWFMDYLKGRGIRKFKKYRPGAILASGVRQDESVKRAASVKPVGDWENVPILAPIFDWTTKETWDYFYDHFKERAPAYSTLQISGDCLCGAYANEGEYDALQFHYPAIGKTMIELGQERDRQMRGCGKKPTRCEWGWGWKQPIKQKADEAMACFDCNKRDLFPETLPEAA